jgi:hypothetical protein
VSTQLQLKINNNSNNNNNINNNKKPVFEISPESVAGPEQAKSSGRVATF